MKRSELLKTAGELIDGQRAQDYGSAKESFQRIADGWNIILTSALTSHGYLTPAHVALMMDWLKTARLLGGDISHEDSWTDKIGYAALGGEIATEGQDDG